MLVCGAVRDLTEAKRAEKELRRLADEQHLLRRVATLVARGSDLDEVVDFVSSRGRSSGRRRPRCGWSSTGPTGLELTAGGVEPRWRLSADQSNHLRVNRGSWPRLARLVDGVAWGSISVRGGSPAASDYRRNRGQPGGANGYKRRQRESPLRSHRLPSADDRAADEARQAPSARHPRRRPAAARHFADPSPAGGRADRIPTRLPPTGVCAPLSNPPNRGSKTYVTWPPGCTQRC